jgi:hypothetical protein
MWSLLKAAVLLGALAAFFFLLPFGGRTLSDRVREANGARDFAVRLWAEMKGEPVPRVAHRPAQKGAARPGEARSRAADDPPVEAHTAKEREALNRLLGDHLADAPRP